MNNWVDSKRRSLIVVSLKVLFKASNPWCWTVRRTSVYRLWAVWVCCTITTVCGSIYTIQRCCRWWPVKLTDACLWCRCGCRYIVAGITSVINCAPISCNAVTKKYVLCVPAGFYLGTLLISILSVWHPCYDAKGNPGEVSSQGEIWLAHNVVKLSTVLIIASSWSMISKLYALLAGMEKLIFYQHVPLLQNLQIGFACGFDRGFVVYSWKK